MSSRRLSRTPVRKSRPSAPVLGSVGKNYVAELLGTFFLCTTIALTAEGGTYAGLAIASVFMCVFCVYEKAGEFNPMVSLALFLTGRNKTDLSDTVYKIFAQLAGAALAAVLYYNFFAGNITAGPALVTFKEDSWWKAFLAELLYSTFVISTAIIIGTTESCQGNSIVNGLSNGLTYAAGVVAVGTISGALCNFAFALGFNIVGHWFGAVNNLAAVTKFYLFSQLLACFLAAFLFRIMYSTEYNRFAKFNELVASGKMKSRTKSRTTQSRTQAFASVSEQTTPYHSDDDEDYVQPSGMDTEDEMFEFDEPIAESEIDDIRADARNY